MLEPIEIDPKTFLREHCSLPALPEAVIRIQGMMRDEGTDSAKIAEIMSGDPLLVAQVLSVVNSAYYALPKTTSNLKFAVAYLGLSVIQRIVISVGVVNTERRAGCWRTAIIKTWLRAIFWKAVIVGLPL